MEEIKEIYRKILLNTEKYKEAEKIVKSVWNKYPLERDVYIEIGKYYIGKDNKKAVKNFEKYISNGGDNEEVKLLLCKIYRQEKEVAKSLELLKRLKSTDEILVERLRCGLELSDEKEIKSTIKKIIEREIKIEEKELRQLCVILEKSNDYVTIEKIFDKYKDYGLEDIKYRYYKRSGDLNGSIREIIKLINNPEFESEKHINKKELALIINDNIKEINKADDIDILIIELCDLIEENDTDTDIIQSLSLILTNRSFEDRERIINILTDKYKGSKKPRAGNIFLNEAEILEKKIKLQSKPRQMVVELTTKCNIKCVMCVAHVTDKKKAKSELSEEDFLFIKDSIPYLERIKWQGGEIFLYKRLGELLKFAGEHKVRQEFVTNGLLLNRDLVEIIAENNILVTFSIDAADKETYESIRCGGSFDKLIENIKLVKEYNDNRKQINYTLIMVVMSVNYMQIENMLDFALKYGFKAISFQKYIYSGRPDLLLNENEKHIVADKINYLKAKYKDDIFIDTNISFCDFDILRDTAFMLENLADNINQNARMSNYNAVRLEKLYDYYKDSKNNPDVKLEDYFTANENVRNMKEKSDEKISEKFESKNDFLKPFCLSPWKVLCMYLDYNIRFTCVANSIDVPGRICDVWNCNEVLKYRKLILENKFEMCNKNCRENGEYSEKIKLGVL